MRKVICHLLLLAVVASICNAQAPVRPQRPIPGAPNAPAVNARPVTPPPNARPGVPQRPVPGSPNVINNNGQPNRQQLPVSRPPGAATRSTAAPGRSPIQPNQPTRPNQNSKLNY